MTAMFDRLPEKGSSGKSEETERRAAFKASIDLLLGQLDLDLAAYAAFKAAMQKGDQRGKVT